MKFEVESTEFDDLVQELLTYAIGRFERDEGKEYTQGELLAFAIRKLRYLFRDHQRRRLESPLDIDIAGPEDQTNFIALVDEAWKRFEEQFGPKTKGLAYDVWYNKMSRKEVAEREGLQYHSFCKQLKAWLAELSRIAHAIEDDQ